MPFGDETCLSMTRLAWCSPALRTLTYPRRAQEIEAETDRKDHGHADGDVEDRDEGGSGKNLTTNHQMTNGTIPTRILPTPQWYPRRVPPRTRKGLQVAGLLRGKLAPSGKLIKHVHSPIFDAGRSTRSETKSHSQARQANDATRRAAYAGRAHQTYQGLAPARGHELELSYHGVMLDRDGDGFALEISRGVAESARWGRDVAPRTGAPSPWIVMQRMSIARERASQGRRRLFTTLVCWRMKTRARLHSCSTLAGCQVGRNSSRVYPTWTRGAPSPIFARVISPAMPPYRSRSWPGR